jgi:hypothetical protein
VGLFGGQKLQAGQFNLSSIQMEHVIAGYIRQVWENSAWLYLGEHGFGPGYSCQSQIITVCQDISDSLDEGSRLAKVTPSRYRPEQAHGNPVG